MILPKLSPKSSGNNILRLTDDLGICCGDGKSCYLVCQYKVAIDLSKTASIAEVEIGGKLYPFDAIVNPATSAGQELLIKKLEKVLNEAGYDGNSGFYAEVKDGMLHIESDYSAAQLGALGDVSFEKTACKLHGDCENSDCCDVALVFSVVAPSKYCVVVSDTLGASGDLIKIVDADGDDSLCWVSDGLGISSFLEGGAAYEALTDAGISFSVDEDLDKVFMDGLDVALVSLYNHTQDAEIAPIAASEPYYLKICPTTCKPIVNVVVNDGKEDVFSGNLGGAGCQISGTSSFYKDGCIYININEAVESGAETVFTVTVQTEGCPDYAESYTLNPAGEEVAEGCEAWEACHTAYKAGLQEFCDLTKALEAGLEVGDEFIVGTPSDLGAPGTRICITQAMIDASASLEKLKVAAVKKAAAKKVAAKKAVAKKATVKDSVEDKKDGTIEK